MKKDNYRVGIGYDIHRLVKGRKLYLGGVQIPYSKGLSGHSDADVLLHAICDAFLGAIGLADIGEYFPNSDKKYKGIRSTQLLKKVLGFIDSEGFAVVNLDTTLIAEAPKVSSWKTKIKKSIARLLKLKVQTVNLKATTAEGIGEVGKNEAIAAWCVALLRRKNR